MQIKIQVLSVNTNHVPNAKGGYDVAEIAYKDLNQGKVGGKKIMSFVDKELYKTVKDLKQNAVCDVEMAKEPGNDGKEYWQWKSVVESTGAAPEGAPAKTGFAAPKSNYETPEERAVKQRLIVRQSSLSNAIAILKTDKKEASVADVILLADQLTEWVYAAPAPSVNKDDIPY